MSRNLCRLKWRVFSKFEIAIFLQHEISRDQPRNCERGSRKKIYSQRKHSLTKHSGERQSLTFPSAASACIKILNAKGASRFKTKERVTFESRITWLLNLCVCVCLWVSHIHTRAHAHTLRSLARVSQNLEENKKKKKNKSFGFLMFERAAHVRRRELFVSSNSSPFAFSRPWRNVTWHVSA